MEYHCCLFLLVLLTCVSHVNGNDASPSPKEGSIEDKGLLFCSAGYFLIESQHGDTCKECEPGYFRSENRHRFTFCLPCSNWKLNRQEKIEKECSTTSDRVVACHDGYFMDIDRQECRRCWDCKISFDPPRHQIRECTKSQNTLCCSQPSFIVVNEEKICASEQPDSSDEEKGTGSSESTVKNSAVPLSDGRPTASSPSITHNPEDVTPSPKEENIEDKGLLYCSAGYFLIESQHGDTCKECEPGHFRSENRHRFTFCLPCSNWKLSRQEKIEKECSTTSDRVVVCHDGYFMDVDRQECRRCWDCKISFDPPRYQIRECSTLKNTLCCPQPFSKVVNKEELCATEPTYSTDQEKPSDRTGPKERKHVPINPIQNYENWYSFFLLIFVELLALSICLYVFSYLYYFYCRSPKQKNTTHKNTKFQ